MLADADSVALVISASLERAGTGLATQLKVTETFRRSGLETDLVNSLGDPDPGVRIAGARICGALRLPNAAPGPLESLLVTAVFGLALLLTSGILAAQKSTGSAA